MRANPLSEISPEGILDSAGVGGLSNARRMHGPRPLAPVDPFIASLHSAAE
jgi:hypothetical protein